MMTICLIMLRFLRWVGQTPPEDMGHISEWSARYWTLRPDRERWHR